MEREKFSSRLGFILISAGCAIGLGNVWRFPYIVGKNGGAAFVLIYLVFLAIFGVPIMVMELSVGRASQKSAAKSFDVLQKPGQKWHFFKYFAIAGNYLLMMFYTTIAGWMVLYIIKMATGTFEGLNQEQTSAVFGQMLSNPVEMSTALFVVVIACFACCAAGLQKGVEKITKPMMVLLLILISVLAVNSLQLEGSLEGVKFYLLPDFSKLVENGISNVVFDAMGQAFFTLSVGMGSIAIFGSYIDKKRSLTGETITICCLDLFVAFVAGLIIFPACTAFGVDVGTGPSLVFQTLPNIFNNMAGGRIWGTLFFIFMSFAALSTVIAVFENIISFSLELFNVSRKKAAIVNIILICILSLPAVLGYNVLDFIQPLGAGSTILDFEDFIVSNNILPLGSLVYVLFCTSRYGWGFKNFMAEANAGNGLKFPKWAKIYVSYILPILILYVFVQGYISMFMK